MKYGDRLPAGHGFSTVLADMDFETYSEAGFMWTGAKWVGPPGAPKNSKGLPVVGVVNYTEHPTFEVLVLKYDLKDGAGPRTWRPGEPNPQPLFDHLAAGLLIEAWNVGFERRAWAACERLYGWPPLPEPQVRCAMAKSRAWSRPGGLDAAAKVAGTPQKDPAGSGLIRDLTMPRKPTKASPHYRLTRQTDPAKFEALDAYCEQDIVAEAALSAVTPDMSPQEREYWRVDQAINQRGVAVDTPLIEAGCLIVDEATRRYGDRVRALTGGIAPSEVAQLSGWCAGAGYPLASMDEDAIDGALRDPACPPLVREVLGLRAKVASASVKKLFALRNTSTKAGRVHDLFIFHGARTGRPTGDGPQPTNFPKAGPNVWRCRCGRHYGETVRACPWCGAGDEGRVDHKGLPVAANEKPQEWSPEAMCDAIEVARSGSLDVLEMFFGDALLTLAGCLRGAFVAAPGHDLISSDWTAIEAVVLACLAGEQWRIDLFREGGKIYEASGAKVGRVEYQELLDHKKRTGQHHPLRQVGKTCELACGYGGWIGSWRAFDPDGPQTDDELKQIILAWREASPALVEFWGGQSRPVPYSRERRDELFGVEGAFISAMLQPGAVFDCRGLKFQQIGRAVYITLLSGRRLTYHDVQLSAATKWGSTYEISYWGWNTNPKNGPRGWIQTRTWGSRLVENITQAVANDILRFTSVNLERAGYPIVLHVYDELVCEMPLGVGSVEELEAWMRYLPEWAVCEDGRRWPVNAAGGWRAERYRKG